jgi:hypothetical protein
VQQIRVEPLRPAAAILGQRLAQSAPIAQPLDLFRRDPRLRQHLPRQQPRQPARVQPIRLRAPPPTEQLTRLHRLRKTDIEAVSDQLAPNPAPARRRLERDRLDAAPAQRPKLSRSAENRSSTTSPLAESNTAA